MLIQAQCQQERQKRCKITANDQEIKNADEPVVKVEVIDDNTDVEMTDLEVKATTETDENAALPSVGGPNDSDKMEMDGQKDGAKEIKIEDNDEDDLYSKDINIDPRTYCKLGHFHLLLEDYPKGTAGFKLFYS